MRNQPPIAGIFPRDRVIIVSCILLIATLAWAYLVRLNLQMSTGPATMMTQMRAPIGASWTASDIFFTFTMWSVMMVGMMSGTAAPVLLLFADMQVQRTKHRASLAILLFGLGYIVIWFGFSALAALSQWGLHQAQLLSPEMTTTSRYLAGVILIAAGVYQLTPVKGACLHQCQSPLGFLMSHWRDGDLGALQMGLRHGVYCLGCCWALMCVLFAVGVMNLAWVAALTAFILLEKFGATGARVARAGGVAIIAFGVVVLAR